MAGNNIKALASATVVNPLPPFPKYPEKMVKMFPELKEHHGQIEEWRRKANVAIFGVTGD